MQLRSIRVRNFRSFKNATLALAPGTTLLWGDVGAGKTSMLYAIEMALFGFAEVEPTYLIRHRATTAEVALTLSDDEHEYVFARRFHRRMRRGRDIFELDEKGTGLSTDGHLTLYPSTELRQRAIDLLGFPDNPNPRAHSDLWRWAVYVPQERMRQILESDDAEARLATVRKALGLERYRTAAENAQAVARELKRDGSQRTGEAERLAHWESDLQEYRTNATTAAAAREAARQAVEEARALVESSESETRRLEERLRQLEGDRRELAELERRSTADESSVRDLQRRLTESVARAESAANEATTLEQAAARLSELAHQAEKVGADRRTVSAELERAEDGRRQLDVAEADLRAALSREAEAELANRRASQEREAAHRRFEELRSTGPSHAPAVPTPRAIPEIEQEVTLATAESERLAGESRHLEASLQDVSALVERGVCPTCGQTVSTSQFGAHRLEVEQALVRAREVQKDAAARRLALTAERAARERYERAQDRWLQTEKLRELGRIEIERADSEAGRLSVELEKARGTLRSAQELATILGPRGPAVLEARERLRGIEREAERLEGQIEELRQKAETARARREAVAVAVRQQEEVRRDIATAQGRLGELTTRATQLRGALIDAEATEEASVRAIAARTETQGELEAAVGRLHRAKGEVDSARHQAEQAELRVAERRSVLAEASRLREISAFLAGPFRDGLLELEHHLLSKAKADFDRSFGRYFAMLIEDPALVARSDARFSPSVEIDGELTPPEALSGGERTALALAFRLALGQTVRKVDRLRLDTLILDEPTDGFSPEQVQRMGELLGELEIPQVILVSHEALLNGVADRVIRVRKVEGTSELVEERGTGPDPAVGADDPERSDPAGD